MKDKRLRDQAEQLVGKPDRSIFIKGPYVTLSRPLLEGKTVKELCDDGIFHRDLHDKSIAEFSTLFKHQEDAARAIKNRKNLVISTSTGSGKTEAFLYPIVSKCLELRDSGALRGVVAVLIYPMNALANDQNERLRRLLAGTGITFGTYTGATLETRSDADRVFRRLGPGVDREQYMLELQKSRADSRVVIPWEEKASVEEMQQSPPNILITNMKQLELILTRGEDVAIFNDNSLSFIVVDEAHTFTGLKGSEVALLIRRLREFAGKKSRDIIHIGTSATIVDPEGNSEEAARKFCSRFFGVNPESVLLISEEYEAREPVEIKYRTVPLKDASDRFGPIVSALGRNNKEVVIRELEEILQTKLERADDPSLIYDTLRAVDIVQVLDKVLEEPLHLEDLAKLTWKELKREEPSGEHLEAAKAEILLWLAIGAATEYNGVRLFRPKLHYFVRGPEGAVIYFHRVNGDWSPMLVESRQQAMRRIQESEKEAASHIETRILDVLYCKNCGQHYYRKKVADLEISREMLRGGAQGISNKDQYWVEKSDGTDIVFTDLLVGVEAQDVKHCDSENLKICAKCGLVQRTSGEICQRPSCRSKDSLLKVWAIVYGSNNGYAPYSYCPACGSYSHREKRTLVEARAVQVADVHILAQEMIQAMPESHRKLLVFADSRQDAAFQAAWMHDHARRYRIRQLFFNALEEGLELTTGDLVEAAIKILKENRELQRIICPDLIEKHEGNLEGREFERDRKKYFHIQLLREICEGSGRMDTLENWGVLCVTYDGIGPESSFVKEIASRFKLDVEMVSDFTNCFLDRWRTSGFVHSPATLLYSTQWDYHNKEEVRDGWIKPSDLYPRAIVLERDDEKNQRIKGVISSRGQTWSMQFAKKVFPDLKDIHSFLHCLWEFLVEQKYLVQVQRSSGGRRNHGLTISGYQVNEEKIRVSRQWEFFVCERCGTVTSRKTPNMKCVAWNCNGKMVRREPTEEIYDMSVLLNRNFTVMVPREHSAQVPHKIRQDIERKFKEGEGVNCIVATPTLELGIDIGDLDGVLLRNVPPDPSNYWQRAGRAGRRQRMAVIYTYCRNMHHDLAYFENPMKMLGGKISPPRINLRNRHMVERHVNATIISAILRIARTPNVTISGERITLTDEERAEVNENFEREIPRHICGIIKDFEKNEYKKDPPKLDYIRDFVCNRFDKIMKKAVISAFEDGYWPEEDRSAIENLEDHIKRFPTNLEEEFSAIFKNFEDAKNLRKKLLELKGEGRLVDEEEKQLLEHIDKYIEQIESRRDLETYTLNVLAARGFLPGYGFDEAGISAGFQSTRSQIPSFSLSRLKSKAIKEFVPGNMLYANGAKFKVIRYSIPPDENRKRSKKKYQLDLITDNVLHAGYTLLRSIERPFEISSVPISDCILAHESRITDEEEVVFRMPCHVLTTDLGEGYRGIKAYSIGEFHIIHYYGMDMIFLNTGPTRIYRTVKDGNSKLKLGFPICPDCGEVRSPLLQLSNSEHIEEFLRKHREEFGHSSAGWYCIESEFDADFLSIRPFSSFAEAVSAGWAIIIGAMDHIEMEADDLELMIKQVGESCFSIWIIDRHPGGSGLLDQVVDNWKKIIGSAVSLCEQCPSQCESSCPSCLRIYENQRDHPALSRKIALPSLKKLEENPTFFGIKGETGIPIPPHGRPDTISVRILSNKLKEVGLIDNAEMDMRIPVESLGFYVRPDIHWLTRDGRHVCIYVDGSIHDLPEVKERDTMIRRTLREREKWIVEVIRNNEVENNLEVERLIRRISEAISFGCQNVDNETLGKNIDAYAYALGIPSPKKDFETSCKVGDQKIKIMIDYAWQIAGRVNCAILHINKMGQTRSEIEGDIAKHLLEKSGWKVWLIDQNTDIEQVLKSIQMYVRT